jgi:hypothetical protein
MIVAAIMKTSTPVDLKVIIKQNWQYKETLILFSIMLEG